VNSDEHVVFKHNEDYRKMWWYNLIGLIWTALFFIACEEITIAGAAATIYFSRDGQFSW
jgi:hypothetical protein